METSVIPLSPDDLSNPADAQPIPPTETKKEPEPERSKTHKRAGITKNHNQKRNKARRLMERHSRRTNRGR